MRDPSVTGAVFVGRERELAVLHDALDAACAGRGSIALLAGEPGIGKTRTAEELAACAGARGVTVYWGRCYEGEGAPAYWPWVQIIRSHVRACDAAVLRDELGDGAAVIAQIVPEVHAALPSLPAPPPLDATQARFRLFDCVTSFLRAIAAREPLVLVLDDLHWADAPSLLLLQFLAREIGQSRLLLVGTYRDQEARPPHPLAGTLAELARGAHTVRLTLTGLTDVEVGQLIGQTSGSGCPAPLVRMIAAETDGNPFFVVECVRFLAASGRFAQPDGPRSVEHAAIVPPGVRDVITQRLDRLSPAGRRVLTVAAVLGREFGLDALGRVAELAGDPLLEVLEEAETAGLIAAASTGTGRYHFVHALVREAIYAALPSTRRIRLHRQVGEALAALYGANAEPHLAELAYHFAEAAATGVAPTALDYARRAGDRALALLAYEEAAAQYRRALALLDQSGDVEPLPRCDLLLALGDAQSRAGEIAEARATFAEAAALARRAGAVQHLARAALGYGGPGVQTGLVDERLVVLLEEALAALGDQPSALRARVLGRLAMELYWSDDRERRIALSGEAVELARRVGDASTLAFALSARHLAFWEPENVRERLAVGEEHLNAARTAGDRQALLEGHARRIPDLLQVGDITAAQDEIERHARLAEELRQPLYLSESLRFRALTAYLHGRFDEMEQRAREALALAERARIGGADVLFLSHLQFLRREQGRYAEMIAPIKEIMARYPRLAESWRLTLANAYAQSGQLAEARRELAASAADGFAALGRGLYSLGVTALLTEAIVAAGAADAAGIVYERLLPYAQHYAVNAASPNFYGSAAHYLGMLAAIMSRWDEAIAHFDAALAMNARTGVPSHIAATQFEYAKALLATSAGRADAAERARVLLTEALATTRELGMRRITEQIEQLHATYRLTAPPAAFEPSQNAPFGDLTPRETEVLRLLADGLSNAEIAAALVVTVNTVERHLSSIYGKLGVHSRTAATAYALRRGLASQR